MNERVERGRARLERLKERLASGEIDRAEFHAQRELLAEGLSPAERVELGVSATPQPVWGASPHAGTPPPTPGPTPIGPSGGLRGGARTSLPSLSDLDLGPGTVLLEQWRLLRELGRGGFGAVFEAEDLHLGERQALKVLDPAMVAKHDLLARFRREVSLMRKLVHPRIVRVFDYREDPRQLVALISMELVPGGSVKQLLQAARERGVEIPLPLALEILGQTLEALAEAHGQGVIHRDVTPGNVLLAGGTPEELLAHPDRDPRVKLVDFGIAGLVERSEQSQKSRVLGTAAYVAPEVLDPSVEVTPAADVYGAGAVGYELLTGKLPLGRFAEPSRLRAAIPAPVNAFLLELLEAQPEARPAARAGVADLHRIRAEAARREAETREAAERAQRDAALQRQEEALRQQAEERRQREAAEQSRRRAAAAAAEAERQQQEAALRERQAAERRAIEAERQAAVERQRQAEQARLAEEARRLREAPPPSARAHSSMDASVRNPPGRSGPSPLAWVGIVALIVAVVAGIGWGVAQQREAERQRAAAAAERQRAQLEASQRAEEQRQAEAAETKRRQQIAETERALAAAMGRGDESAATRYFGSLEALLRPNESNASRTRAAQWLAERERARQAAAEAAAAPVQAAPRPAVATPAASSSLAARANPAGLEWVRIPGGSFTMGCTSGDAQCDADENPAHRVTLRSFALATTETTVGQYQRCVSAGGCSTVSSPGFSQGQDHPVVNVDWNQAKSFCSWAGGRLPSESEWEYAARGGREGWKYPWGNELPVCRDGATNGARFDDDASCDSEKGSRTAPVKNYSANGYGLYDMSGNVWEWVEDVWHDNYGGAPTDGSAWTSGGAASRRVLRGGSWFINPRYLRVSDRYLRTPDYRIDFIGFRCARTEIP